LPVDRLFLRETVGRRGAAASPAPRLAEGKSQPWSKNDASGFVLAKRPDGFGYQSQTCIVISSGCQKLNFAPDDAVVGQSECAAAGTYEPSV
jgi:hypothetical protein